MSEVVANTRGAIDVRFARLSEVMTSIIRGLVDVESRVDVQVFMERYERVDVGLEGLGDEREYTVVKVRVAPNDSGKVIGRRGQTVDALRSIAHAVANKLGLPGANVRVEDPHNKGPAWRRPYV